MLKIPPRVAVIDDLSCFGRCALTVIIPTLSTMGIQVVPYPTALLSTHTGGFDNLFFKDLSLEMDEISAHFKRLDLKFDAIYTGFLGSEAQIKKVSDFIDDFGGKATPVMVDPVMGDDGSLYSTYTSELLLGVKSLVKKADIITPNYTEACFLTDTPYKSTDEMTDGEVATVADELLEKLKATGAKKIVITGFASKDNVFTFGTENGDGFVNSTKKVNASYPGTGDIFASVLLGKTTLGESFRQATDAACKFTADVIAYTLNFDTPHRDGVMLEPNLHKLFR